MSKEEKLLKGCYQNNHTSQKELFEHFATQLYHIANRYVNNSSEAEDIVAVAFTRVFKKINSFSWQGIGSFEAWIRRIAVNECLMYLRKRHNFNLLTSLEEVQLHSDLQPLAALHAEDILTMVSQLPTGYRTVFNLYVVEGYNHAEIARQLEISEGTSRSQLLKAKEQLKKMLENESNSYGTIS